MIVVWKCVGVVVRLPWDCATAARSGAAYAQVID